MERYLGTLQYIKEEQCMIRDFFTFFDEHSEVNMNSNFEEKFMEIQTDFISLCLELTESKVDKVFAYASIEKKSTMFNAFFVKSGKVYTINQLNVDRKTAMELLKIGTRDLEKIKVLCKENDTQIPTEIKMIYDRITGKYNADYKYDEIKNSL